MRTVTSPRTSELSLCTILRSILVLPLIGCGLIGWGLIGWGLIGCSHPPGSVPADGSEGWRMAVDLAAELPWAEIRIAPERIDVGSAGARAFLGGGWSTDEHDARDGLGDGSFAWAVGPVSELRWPILEPRDRTLYLHCRPFRWPAGSSGGSPPGAPPESPPAQTVTVEVVMPKEGAEGESVVLAELELSPELSIYEVPWPASLQSVGEMGLRLRWGRHRSPAELGLGGDRRQLAAAVYGLGFGGLGFGGPEGSSTAPTVPTALADGRWWLPWGSRIEIFLPLPGQTSRLVAEGWSWRGEGRLELEGAWEGGEWRPLASITEPPSGAVELDWGSAPTEDDLVGLRLSLLGGSTSTGAGGGIVVEAPQVEVPGVGVPEGSDIGEASPVVDPVVDPGARAVRGTGPGNDGGRPPVILYVIDTLRADRLAGWHGERSGPPTPHLDAFAREARIFEHARAQSSWTKASMATVLTGLEPLEHGAYGRRHVLAAEHLRLPEILGASGWRTAAFVTNPNLAATFGFDRGFEHFEYLGEEARAEQVSQRLADWLASTSGDPRPPFLWLHVLDPHSPYAPPEEIRRRFAPDVPAAIAADSLGVVNDLRAGRRPMSEEVLEQVRALYDAEVAQVDRAFGELRALLEAEGLYDRSWIVLLSDHGEEFMEHGNLEHGRALFAESIRVPFWIKPPVGRALGSGLETGTWPEPVQHLDFLPSLLAALGLEPPEGSLRGRSDLLTAPVPRTASAGEPRLLFAHLHLDGAERVSVFDGHWELLVEVDAGTGRLVSRRLFDLERDPGQVQDRLDEHPIRAGWLASALRRYLAEGRSGARSAEDAELDDELRRSLEALGYL